MSKLTALKQEVATLTEKMNVLTSRGVTLMDGGTFEERFELKQLFNESVRIREEILDITLGLN